MKKPGWKSAAELEVSRNIGVKLLSVAKLVPEGTLSPPSHLSAEASAWWQSVVADYDLEPHHLRLLQSAAEAWDRMQQARQALADHGALTFTDQNGGIKARPCVAMERDARIAFARLVRELDLDAGALIDRSRPPALYSNRR